MGLKVFVLNHQLLQLIEIARQRSCDSAGQGPLRLFQLDEEGRQLIADGSLAQFRPVAQSSSPFELIKQLVDFVDFALEASQLRIVGISLLQQLLGVLIESFADGIALILAHGHKLRQIPALDNFDGGEDHVLTHAHLLLQPKGFASVVLAFQTLGGFRGFGIRGRDQEAHAGHLTFDSIGRNDLPFRL